MDVKHMAFLFSTSLSPLVCNLVLLYCIVATHFIIYRNKTFLCLFFLCYNSDAFFTFRYYEKPHCETYSTNLRSILLSNKHLPFTVINYII